ncbi:hypothetical protein [Phytohalomonas tamaricis]|uniref:hypothetical protein n=1 Tax=Phytohalomonas tamaricis TaxID=2081032 RepID=UPI000D0AFBD0|nr:hypothetical protein [Phytohalomonas tamaricis]
MTSFVPPPHKDRLRAAAITSQAIGFILILAFQTWLPEPRPAQGITLACMLLAALVIATIKRYRINKQRRQSERNDAL